MISIMVVAAILLLIGPKKAQQTVVVALLLYCFPKQAVLALVIAAVVYYSFHKFKSK